MLSKVVFFVLVGLVMVNNLLLVNGLVVKLIFYFFFSEFRFFRCKLRIFMFYVFYLMCRVCWKRVDLGVCVVGDLMFLVLDVV